MGVKEWLVSRDSVGAGLHLELTFTSPSRLGQGREGGFVSFFWVWSKKTKQPRLESSSSPLDPTGLPSLPNFLRGEVVR